MDADLIKILEAYLPTEPLESSHPQQKLQDIHCRHCSLITLPANIFNYEEACIRLQCLPLPVLGPVKVYDDTSVQRRILALSSIISFENMSMIRSAGALLAHVLNENMPKEYRSFQVQKRPRKEIDGENGNEFVSLSSTTYLDPHKTSRLIIYDIHNLDLEHRMKIDIGTMEQLDVINTEMHPSVYGIGCTKEGISLLSLLGICTSIGGKRLMQKWVLTPMTSISKIQNRLNEIQFIINYLPDEIILQLKKYLRLVGDILKSVVRVQRKESSPIDWKNILDSVNNINKISDILLRDYGHLQGEITSSTILQLIQVNQNIELNKLERAINESINFPQSMKEDRLILKVGIDLELDEMKNTLTNLDEFLDALLEDELKQYPLIPSLRVLYIPQMGFQIAIPITNSVNAEELISIINQEYQSVEYQFLTSKYLYCKTKTTKELDSSIGDIHSRISDRETDLVSKFSIYILENTSLMIERIQLCNELDCLLALAEISRNGNYSRPQFVDDPTLQIKHGYHPLHEIFASENGTIIPNNTDMSIGSSGLFHIITGPNNSGKSVYLKQVGLLVYMAQIGCFVPAESMKLSLFDSIFSLPSTRSANQPSIFNYVSAKKRGDHVEASIGNGRGHFLSSLMSVGKILHHATARSLILLDEFGRETTELDGMGLLISTINSLTTRVKTDPGGEESTSTACPLSIVTTHLDIAHSPYLKKNPDILQLYHMKFLLPETLSSEAKDTTHPPCDGRENAEKSPLTIEQPVFLYKIGKNVDEPTPNHAYSMGIYCAQMAGLNESIIERSKEISLKLSKWETIDSLPFDDGDERLPIDFKRVLLKAKQKHIVRQNKEDLIIEELLEVCRQYNARESAMDGYESESVNLVERDDQHLLQKILSLLI